MRVYQIEDQACHWDGEKWKPIEVGDRFRRWNGFNWCFYEVLELDPNRFGNHRTGFKLKNDQLSFWVSNSELSSYEPETTTR